MILPLFFACAAAVDPAGDVPPPPAPLPDAPRAIVAVAELDALGLDPAEVELANSELLKGLLLGLPDQEVHPLQGEQRERARACRDDVCFDAIAKAVGAVVVVHGSAQRVAGNVVVVVDAGRAHAAGAPADAGLTLAQQWLTTKSTTTTPNPRLTPAKPEQPTKPTSKVPPGLDGAPKDDMMMLLVDYGIFLAAGLVPGGILLLPLVQGLVHKEAGPQLTGNEYPEWWQGTLAGYGVIAIGATIIIVGYGGGLALLFSTVGNGNSNQTVPVVLILGGIVLGSLVYLSEPAVLWGVSHNGAVAAAVVTEGDE